MKIKSSEAKSESDEPRCWIENPQTQILRMELSDGSFHLSPYAWLVWVQFSPNDETDALTLIFNVHTVSIVGNNLRELALAFQRMCVESVKVSPPRRKPSKSNEMPFIQSIHIEDHENTD